MDMAKNLNEYLHSLFVLHLNKLDVLLVCEKLCRVVVDALIMYQFSMLCRQKAWGEAPSSSSSGDEGESYEWFLMWKHKISYLNIKLNM